MIKPYRFQEVFILFLLLLVPGLSCGYLAEELSPDLIVPELTNLGLSQIRIEKHAHPRLERLYDREDRYFLIVHLGQLTRAQFNKVKALYGNHTTVNYVQGKHYRLKDFMPPLAQAVLNRTFIPVTYDLSYLHSPHIERNIERLGSTASDVEERLLIDGLLSKGLTTETNCWNATVEILNSIKGGSSTYRVFTPARWEIDHELKSAGKAVTPGSRLKAWDVLLVSQKSPYTGQEILQHTALVINESLVFEKVGSTADDPYRISLLSDVLGKYRRALAETFRMEYRRYSGVKLLFPGSGVREEPYSPFTGQIIREITTWMQPERLSYGCDTGEEGNCTYSFQVIEYLELETDKEGGKLRGRADLLNRFQKLE